MTRDEAITWLRSVGRNASARDWALGETIVIPMGEPDTTSEITVWPGVLYIRPLGDGRWELQAMDTLVPDREVHPDLATGARAADGYAGRWEAERAEKMR